MSALDSRGRCRTALTILAIRVVIKRKISMPDWSVNVEKISSLPSDLSQTQSQRGGIKIRNLLLAKPISILE